MCWNCTGDTLYLQQLQQIVLVSHISNCKRLVTTTGRRSCHQTLVPQQHSKQIVTTPITGGACAVCDGSPPAAALVIRRGNRGPGAQSRFPLVGIIAAGWCNRVPAVAPASASSQSSVRSATCTIGKGGNSRAATRFIGKGGDSRAASVGHLGLPAFQDDAVGVEAPASQQRPWRCETARGWGRRGGSGCALDPAQRWRGVAAEQEL
jgi:hypothetical protein